MCICVLHELQEGNERNLFSKLPSNILKGAVHFIIAHNDRFVSQKVSNYGSPKWKERVCICVCHGLQRSAERNLFSIIIIVFLSISSYLERGNLCE